MSNGKIILVVGDMGAGKTSFIKDRFSSKCKQKKSLCYVRIKTDWDDDNKIMKFTNFMNFLETANKKKDTLCLIDEAYTCLPKKLNISMDNPNHPHNKLADFLVNSRKMNNFVVIILHSLSQIPSEWLLMYVDYIVRFKTNDLLQYQIQRFKSFPNIANNLIQIPVVQDYKPIILKLR